ncbi:MAG: LysR family transcriptional regulator [Marmoricola sp.]|nr:LysR family transcriptional regulator [Marmoricola sp.]
MQLDPRRLAVLLDVHRYGGVLAAADEGHVTASAISQQMAKLEAEVGVAVLDRQPGGAVLTSAGRVLVDAAERIESELTDARRALAELQGEVTGTVVIGAFQSVIQAVLVPLVADLAERMPGIQLMVRDVAADDGLRDLRAGSVDLLLLEADSPVGRTAPRGTHDVAVLDEPWMVVVPASMPEPKALDDLAHSTWLGVDPTAAAHHATDRVRSMFTSAPPTAHTYSNSDVALSMVAGGLGIALLPSLALVGAVRRDRVQAVSLPGLGTRRVIARHRRSRAEPRREVLSVLGEVVAAAAALDLSDV